jgi:hypothetical protein
LAFYHLQIHHRTDPPGAPDPVRSASRPEETKEVIVGAKLSTFLWQHPVAVLLSGEVLRD